MNSIILHISDLHISLDKKIGGEVNKHDSYLDTSFDNEPSFLYIDRFTAALKRDYEISKQKIYLLITGDITNEGEKKEFDFALTYLNRIIKSLNIQKENILLLPGDHDLNRRSIINLLETNDKSTIQEINDAKYKNFSIFYNNLLNKVFEPNRIVFDTLIIDDSLILLGLNSCTKIDLLKKLGNVPIIQFEEEISHIIKESPLKMIACVHHNLTSAHDDKNSGQWDADNRESFLQKILSNGIGFVFTGNEHTNSCKSLFLGEITTSDSGCFSSKSWDTTFKVYEIIKNDDVVLKNTIYSLHKPNINDFKYEWDTRKNKIFSQPEEFVVFKKNPPLIDVEISELPSQELEKSPELKENLIENDFNVYYNVKYTDLLYDKVKDLKLYHSGHFHWSETSRAHNWIDVSKLIEDKENLDFVKNAVVDVIEDKKMGDVDLIIGLGYEGNIISSKAAIKYNKPYTFLPYSYRHDEHHTFENELNFDNSSKKYKKILIITDVVNDGRTIRKLINKRQKAFFSNVDQVYVISLFYTGESILNFDILNFDFIKTISNYDIENDEEVNNIEFYTVKSLKVEKCPYGKDFRETCLIVKDKLGCVNLFYDESKYIKK